MPRKKTTPAAAPASEEAKPKTKRKVVRRVKKSEPDLSSLPNNAGPIQMDSVARPVSADLLHNKQPVAPLAADQHEVMRDIKPREHHRDAAFLIPEKFGFDLKPEQHRHHRAQKTHFMRWLAYSLVVLILILLGGLFLISSYSNKMLGTENNNAVVDNSQSAVPSVYSMSFSNVPAALKPALQSVLTSKFGNDLGLGDYPSALPEVKADTLFVKDSASQENTDILNELAANGIKAEIRQVDGLQNNAVLYLVTLLTAPDLSGLTSAVYNGTGVSGLAKKNCDILTSYKVVTCQALNSPSPAKGNTVTYKNIKALFVLKRTAPFQNAVYSQAGKDQVEDIRVTLGR